MISYVFFLILLFGKEFLLFNQEIIIYTVFIVILAVIINTFSDNIFNEIRVNTKAQLNVNSLQERVSSSLLEQRFITIANLTLLHNETLRKLGKITIILMFLQCCLETQYAEAHFIEQQQPNIENIIRGYNAEELIIFNEELGIDPQQLFLAIQENPNQVENERVPNTQNRYDALILFILGTLALFLITRYGSTILENLFDFAREMPGAIQRSIAGIIRFAAETGRLNAVYDITTREAQNLLNDPDTANRVVRGMQRVQEFRNR